MNVTTIHHGRVIVSPREQAVYCRPDGVEMVRGTHRSTDNGETWTADRIYPGWLAGIPAGWRRHALPPWFDERNDLMVTFINAIDWPIPATIREPDEAFERGYLRYAVSTDGGRSYMVNHPIIAPGLLPGVMLGDLGNRPIVSGTGDILLPIQCANVDDVGRPVSPGGGRNYSYVRVLHGRWNVDGTIGWRAGPKIMGNASLTVRGLMEPTLIMMPNGTLCMVMRGSNGGLHDPQFRMPSRRWMTHSRDHGSTWSTPTRWVYDDTDHANRGMFSPASMSRLIQHSSGRVFWIGNISPANCQGNNPRHPLVIGEVSPVTLLLRRETVVTLDSLQPTDTNGLNLSHFWAYEDRVTGEIRVQCRRYTGDYSSFTGVEYVLTPTLIGEAQ